MVVLAAGLLASFLMFLVQNVKVQKGCVTIIGILSLYMGRVAVRIGSGYFLVQVALSVI